MKDVRKKKLQHFCHEGRQGASFGAIDLPWWRYLDSKLNKIFKFEVVGMNLAWVYKCLSLWAFEIIWKSRSWIIFWNPIRTFNFYFWNSESSPCWPSPWSDRASRTLQEGRQEINRNRTLAPRLGSERMKENWRRRLVPNFAQNALIFRFMIFGYARFSRSLRRTKQQQKKSSRKARIDWKSGSPMARKVCGNAGNFWRARSCPLRKTTPRGSDTNRYDRN